MFNPHRLAFAACALLATPPLGSQTPSVRTATFDSLYARALTEWNVPGFSVAIVRNDSLVYSAGFGVREVGQRARVTDRTVFYTASITKAFTAVALGQLADSGKLRVNDPVRKVLPEFAVGDSLMSATLTLADLLTQRTSLPRADLLLLSGASNAQIIQRLAVLRPAAALRNRLAYNNQMYLVLGEVASRASGRPFAELLEQRVLAPLGMTSSNARGAGGAAGTDIAGQHALVDGRAVSFPALGRPGYGAGAVNASARDLAQWVRALLNGGKVGATRIFSEGVAQALRTPQTIASPISLTPGATMAAYAMGGYVHDFQGHLVVEQVGQGEGSSAVVMLIPRSGIGIVVLANLQGTLLPQAVAAETAKSLLGLTGPNWLRDLRVTDSLTRVQSIAPSVAAPRATDAATLPVTQLRGTFSNPLYGDVQMTVDRDSLLFAYGPWVRGTLVAQVANRYALRTFNDAVRAVLPGAVIDFRGVRGDTLLLQIGGEAIPFARTGQNP